MNETLEKDIEKALRQNKFIHKYVMAIVHALLWVAALSFAAFFHLSDSFSHDEALLFSTLVAYGAYLCESGLGTVKEAAVATMSELDFRKAGLWKWIALNIAVNTMLSFVSLQSVMGVPCPHYPYRRLAEIHGRKDTSTSAGNCTST